METESIRLTIKIKLTTADWINKRTIQKPNENLNAAQAVKQGDQKVSVHLMITIQKISSNAESVPRQSPDIY